jgi:atypical dual specificity phosphatase
MRGVATGQTGQVRPPTWIDDGRLIAGPHPSASVEATGRGAVLDALLRDQVSLFLDLTQRAELEPYEQLLPTSVRFLRAPIHDFSIPSSARLAQTLDVIDAELARGGVVYVHCWAGCGRTGVVVACWLIRHGHPPEDALADVARLRGPGCPQTLEQRLFVLGWREPRALPPHE